MKLLKIGFTFALACVGHGAGQAQIVPSCLGCMPRTGKVVDSTMTTPSPPFTTSASTGNIYIPPRVVEVEVPAPAPPPPAASDPLDPSSFDSTKFTCSAGGRGFEGARGAALTKYITVGNRCADTDGLTYWASNLLNCVAIATSNATAQSMTTSVYEGYLTECKITAGITKDINTVADQNAMNDMCVADAVTRKFKAPHLYKYQRGRTSSTCIK